MTKRLRAEESARELLQSLKWRFTNNDVKKAAKALQSYAEQEVEKATQIIPCDSCKQEYFTGKECHELHIRAVGLQELTRDIICLKHQVTKARNEALEEAAQYVESCVVSNSSAIMMDKFANEIRALKTK